MTIDPVQFGVHEGRLQALDDRMCRVENTVEAINGKLDTIIESLAEKRGEWRATAYIAGLAGTLVSVIVAVAVQWLD